MVKHITYNGESLGSSPRGGTRNVGMKGIIMPININCIYNDSGAWCKNVTIKRSLFGLGARCCVLYPHNWNGVCSQQRKVSRPISPPPAPFPLGNK